jgi:hypothetical protein
MPGQDSTSRGLSDLGDCREYGGRASTGFFDVEAQSGALQRDSGKLRAVLPPTLDHRDAGSRAPKMQAPQATQGAVAG